MAAVDDDLKAVVDQRDRAWREIAALRSELDLTRAAVIGLQALDAVPATTAQPVHVAAKLKMILADLPTGMQAVPDATSSNAGRLEDGKGDLVALVMSKGRAGTKLGLAQLFAVLPVAANEAVGAIAALLRAWRTELDAELTKARTMRPMVEAPTDGTPIVAWCRQNGGIEPRVVVARTQQSDPSRYWWASVPGNWQCSPIGWSHVPIGNDEDGRGLDPATWRWR